jgi:hypothetical protein
MDLNQTELLVVEQTADEARVNEMRQLAELQLVLVGGGIGETIL